jgi:mono/diheme cytochrome c family protein
MEQAAQPLTVNHAARSALAMLLLAAAACGGGGEKGMDSAQTAAPPPAAPATPAVTGEITPAMVALGDSIFHGQVGGAICFTCHGPDGKGSPLGPDLTDATWRLATGGTHEAIIGVVTGGVPTPQGFPGPMPALGGGALSPDQVSAGGSGRCMKETAGRPGQYRGPSLRFCMWSGAAGASRGPRSGRPTCVVGHDSATVRASSRVSGRGLP